MNFKEGDKVIGQNFKYEFNVLNGKKGVVRLIEFAGKNRFALVGVEWECEFDGGHNLTPNERHLEFARKRCRWFSISGSSSSSNLSNLKLVKDYQMEFCF